MTSKIELVDQILEAFSAGDFGRIREIVAPDVRIWHNDGTGEQDLEQNIAGLRILHSLFDHFSFMVHRRAVTENMVSQTHTLKGVLIDGTPFALQAAMWFEFSGDRVVRIEEFYDPAVVNELLSTRAGAHVPGQ